MHGGAKTRLSSSGSQSIGTRWLYALRAALRAARAGVIIAAFFFVLVLAKSNEKSLKPKKKINDVTSVNLYNGSQTQPANNTMLLILLYYDLCFTALTTIWHVISILLAIAFGRKLKWMMQTVSGRKHHVAYHISYFVSHSVTSICVLIMSIHMIHFQLNPGQNKTFSPLDINYMILITVFASAWSILHYLQLIPGLNVSVIAVQQMLLDLLYFSIISTMFLLSFSFGFYVLTDSSRDFLPLLYDIFRLMLNMIDFSEASGTVQFLHVVFVFTIVYLLQNIIIAIFSSSYQHVYQNKDIIFCVQSLFVSLIFDPVCSRIMRPLYNRLRRKHLIYEDDKIYVSKVVMKPTHTEFYDNQNQANQQWNMLLVRIPNIMVPPPFSRDWLVSYYGAVGTVSYAMQCVI